MTSILATSVALRDTLYVVSQNSGFPWNIVPPIVSAGISFLMLIVALRTFREHNRPYITFNIESELDGGLIFFFIRNTGIRGAHDVEISISPMPKSYALAKSTKHKDRDKFIYAFLAPSQTIRTVFDKGLHRYYDGHIPDTDVFDISITYKYKNRNFKDNYKCDISYLRHIIYPSTPTTPIKARGIQT